MQVPESCRTFAYKNRVHLGQCLPLRRVFTCHLVNLYEYCLLDADQLDACLRILDPPTTPSAAE